MTRGDHGLSPAAKCSGQAPHAQKLKQAWASRWAR
eukprot:CAMPEP_0177393516 /NCGR_PEP_ID=MMETSP0368-20130122/55004_1 /TAXON_ID=447022 ORGANISM="Scrippsiella hangoei-like, Strain SHHI-4" /NCGR_SAMPLE_ID=MMETSP0368 /ASSEMBLY_ACC=CAM_ASM_000363 /LENGTH=34 /DNA_ID= /DNA_START= /DNA_END= /DNA_ORIENTATION=